MPAAPSPSFGSPGAVARLAPGAVAALPEAMQAECALLMRERGAGVAEIASAARLRPEHVEDLLFGRPPAPFRRLNETREPA